MENNNNDQKRVKEARAFFKEAAEEYCRENFQSPPPLDLSFISTAENKRKNKIGKAVNRWVAIAATVVIVIGGTAIFEAVTYQNQAYGDWGILHRLINTLMGGIVTDNDVNQNELGTKLTITAENKIQEGKKEFSQLYIPTYIPEKYIFYSLEIERFGTGTIYAIYEYRNGEYDRILRIEQTYMPDMNVQYDSFNSGEGIELADRLIRIMESDESVEVYSKRGLVVVYGDVTQDEMLKVAKQLQ